MSIPSTLSKDHPHFPHIILGIEASCDETAAAVLRQNSPDDIEILSSVIASQDAEHAPFGGVVPEIAARAHLDKLSPVIAQAIDLASIEYDELSAVAATAGPGLIGGVIAGLMAAKGLALSLDIPLIAINHLEGHALSPRLAAPCPFPYVLLLVSGGHTQLLSVNALGDYTRLGSTVDDAAGEAFDKSAKVMDLGFPGGPHVERIARRGDPCAVALPRPFKGTDHANFSFAGLKTAVARAWAASAGMDQDRADISASFQQAVCDVLSERSGRAMDMFRTLHPHVFQTGNPPPFFVVAGGVAANAVIREQLTILAHDQGFGFLAPPLEFCTDNAAMIALAGAMHYRAGHTDALDVRARPRWPLDQRAAQMDPTSGSGKKGPKS